jgi:CTD kinase subunit beta
VELERNCLEAVGLELETRHPQEYLLATLQTSYKVDPRNSDHKTLLKAAWDISTDLNLTFALLKQPTDVMALAVAELAFRLHNRKVPNVVFPNQPASDQTKSTMEAHPTASTEELAKLGLDVNATGPSTEVADEPESPHASLRGGILETMLDVLDLYTTHRPASFAGSRFAPDRIMQVQITLNRMADRYQIPRYGHWIDDYIINEGPKFLHELAGDASGTTSPINGNLNGNRSGSARPSGEVIAVRRFVLQPSDANEELDNLDEYYVSREEEYDAEEETTEWETASDDDEPPPPPHSTTARERPPRERDDVREADYARDRHRARDQARDRDRDRDWNAPSEPRSSAVERGGRRLGPPSAPFKRR